MKTTVKQSVRLAVTQLRLIESLVLADRTEEVGDAAKALRDTLVRLFNDLGLKKGDL